ncbi:Alpha/Beta hydrolase protein [Kickxella alabastrina]|uniref:Alpha/Beta hydrolase protein n=1 Tax=Kickxella alabastrina TaxID=61397 RepID=UPI00221F6B39|nr:Alpha/Beta hydrolase protein [Kickxella alabastrina]KAI7824974.1 Alpha/Beta hydrolase protein [Kickxella alabastrina]
MKVHCALLLLNLLFALLLTTRPVGAASNHNIDTGDLPLPVVIWHGMGDTCCDNNTMGAVAQTIKDELPGVFVHSVRLGSSEGADRNAGFFGNLNSQVDSVCSDLTKIPQLQGRGINMMGFSQGGLFLRALIERCPNISARALVTFGSPHSGVARVPECASEGDVLCNWMRQLAARGVYSWYVRDHVIQAQYFKDPRRLDQYLQHNIFLPDINGEIAEHRDKAYGERIRALEKMVLVRFSEDNMIYPAASSWFGFVDERGNETSLHESQMYAEDWLGLRELDESNRLSFVLLPGKHLSIGTDNLRKIISEHFGTQVPESKPPVFLVQNE